MTSQEGSPLNADTSQKSEDMDEDSAGSSASVRVKGVEEINSTVNNPSSSEESGKRKLPAWMQSNSDDKSVKRSKNGPHHRGNAQESKNRTENDQDSAVASSSNIDDAPENDLGHPQRPQEDQNNEQNNEVDASNEAASTNEPEDDKNQVEIKTEPTEPCSSNTVDESGGDNAQEVEVDESKVKSENGDSSEPGSSSVVDSKKDIKVVKVEATSSTRDSCKFGIRCYRLNKAPKTAAERGREFRTRKTLLKQQSKQQQEPDAIVEIATEDIRSAGPSEDNQVPGPSEIRTIEKRAKSAEATRRWREKKKGVTESSKKQAKTAAQRIREYRERKKLAKKILLKQQSDQDLDAIVSTSSSQVNQRAGPSTINSISAELTRRGKSQSQQQIETSERTREYCERRNDNINIESRNPQHRIEEAHPGDSDYRRPDFPDPPKGTPPCPYGDRCYRRNPTHFQNFTHPPSTDFKKNWQQRQKRQRKQKKDADFEYDDDFIDDADDDESLHDPFSDDASDDEYVPSDD